MRLPGNAGSGRNGVGDLETGMHLMVVDDEPEILRFIEFVARDAGWAVESVDTEKSFRSAYRKRIPDAIVLDLKLGHSDGVELMRFLGAESYSGNLMLISGSGDRILAATRERAEILGLNVSGAESKPIPVARLREILKRMEMRPVEDRSPAPHDAGYTVEFRPEEIISAVDNGELELHLQPIINARDHSVTKCEALVRWRHPEFGMIMPDRFISVAEQDDTAIDRLTSWVIGTAAAYCRHMRDEGVAIGVSVNVSRLNLHSLDFPDVVSRQIERQGLPPSAISFELTESAAVQDAGRVVDILSRLSLKGFQLMIDDFGTGYSSLQVIRHMPFSVIKLDKLFIQDLPNSRDDLAIVKSVIELAHNLRLETIAEGVETAEEVACLSALGITGMQGFYFSRPLDLDTAITWLGARARALELAQPAATA
jgi:EAL domain-containing protein (putative c-di-GMP-specific phosphodiesterase class I)